jgi:PPM family protein phosphatase
MSNSVGLDHLGLRLGNAQHIGRRRDQQDAFGCSDTADEAFLRHGGVLAVVADGSGGLARGDLASRRAVEKFLAAYHLKTEQESVAQALERALRESQDAIRQLGVELRAEGNIGSTLIAAALTDAGLYWISVGDSALLQFSAGGLRQLNRTHIFARRLEQAVAKGVLSVEDALNNPNREALTSYLGCEELTEIDANPEPLKFAPGERLLLCSDGLYRVLEPDEIITQLRAESDPQAACEALIASVIGKNKERQDNVTVMCIAVEDK